MSKKHLPGNKRKEQILDAAFHAFHAKSYHQTKMDDIAKRARLSKGSIYRFFPSKRELFLCLFEHVVSKFENEVLAHENLTEQPKLMVNQIIEIFITHLKEKKNIWLADMKFWAMASRDKKFRQHVNDLYDRWTKRFEFLFREGIKKGEFINMDTRVATLTLICLIDGFIYRSVGSGELDIKRDVRVVFEEFMKIVSPPTEH